MVLAGAYSPKYKYAVFWSPKAGCSTLRNFFLELHKDELAKHVKPSFHSLQTFFPCPRQKDGIPSLLVVRNPYKRCVSMFIDKFIKPPHNTIKRSAKQKLHLDFHDTSFLEFLLLLKSLKDTGKLNALDIHSNEQAFNQVMLNKTTTIIKLENFKTELLAWYSDVLQNTELLQKIHNLDASQHLFETPINPVNYTKESSDTIVANHKFTGGEPEWPTYRQFYNDETAALVYDIYKRDFDLGGYDKDSWKSL